MNTKHLKFNDSHCQDEKNIRNAMALYLQASVLIPKVNIKPPRLFFT